MALYTVSRTAYGATCNEPNLWLPDQQISMGKLVHLRLKKSQKQPGRLRVGIDPAGFTCGVCLFSAPQKAYLLTPLLGCLSVLRNGSGTLLDRK